MALWGDKDRYADAPKSVARADTGASGQDEYGNTVFGVDADEARASGATVPHSGWVRRVEGTGGRSGRVQEEVLVAMSSAAFTSASNAEVYEDATDFANTSAEPAANGTADDTEYPDS